LLVGSSGKRIAKGAGQKKAQERITLLVKYLQTIQDK
jgi:hypothetical protein